ncbi:MAG: hypothetical protein CMJ89_05245 [Planctomycetes bacterium]|nr:hypothetical protein [Planctomycetota bacterium]
MRMDASTDIEELFLHASSLDGAQRDGFVRSLRERDGDLADLLLGLLSADEAGHARVPEDPRLTQARVAARQALEEEGSAELDAGSKAILDRVGTRTSSSARYTLGGEVGRGGMGAVLEVWDVDLQRKLAMKVVLEQDHPGSVSTANSMAVARFLEEAQVTGQLDHPGIVPVHELGLDEQKRVYFTMRLVRGRPLDEIIELVRDGREGWNVVRGLGVFLKVCEAMAYAHSKGVIHRDLKPANIMVGRFGEVYVMDWGVARVLGSDQKSGAPALRRDPTVQLAPVRTARASGRDEGTADPLMTREGSVIGTPYFMPVEQARGDFEKVDARSDVYALGAMLYQLLTGLLPYQKSKQERNHPHAVLAMALNGPPLPIHELAPRASAELSAICNKAMARQREDRYADMFELSEDLRAYLENRVVRAYATGPLVELRKWVVRNKAVAVAGLLGFLLILVGLVAGLQREKRLLAEEYAQDYRLLLTYAQSEENALRVDSSEMWPAIPDKIPAYDEWLGAVQEWLGGADEIRRMAEEKRREGIPVNYRKPEELELKHLRELAEIEESLPPQGSLETLRFEDPQDLWLHEQTARLERAVEELQDPSRGLIDGITAEHGWGIKKRRAWAAQVEELTVTGAEAAAAWDRAIAAIAGSPLYDGLKIEPQLGLLPIGPGPRSQLWEFCLLQTGEAPRRDAQGFLANEVESDAGLLFVLIPSGTFLMGAQSEQEDELMYDPAAERDEGPVHEVTMTPFFLSKYEMNQAQWTRLTGENPSIYTGDSWNPVNRVSWVDCMRVLGWIGCTLPSEAQWEYAVRAGTMTPWWSGEEVRSLARKANLADRSLRDYSTSTKRFSVEEELYDRVPYLARADRFNANLFGMHGMIGNVAEWCMDAYTEDYSLESVFDPLSDPVGEEFVARGGSYRDLAIAARSANRRRYDPDRREQRIGVRPARKIEGELQFDD